KELAPRAVIAAIGVNLSLFLLGQGIVISNELVKGFLQVDPNSLSITTDRLVQSGTVAPIVLSLLLIGALFLLLSNLIRVVIVVLLGIGGPIMQVFGVLPQTDGVARGWWRATAACLIAPAFAVIALVAWLMTTVLQLPLALTMPILAVLSGLAISTTLIKADGLSPDRLAGAFFQYIRAPRRLVWAPEGTPPLPRRLRGL